MLFVSLEACSSVDNNTVFLYFRKFYSTLFETLDFVITVRFYRIS